MTTLKNGKVTIIMNDYPSIAAVDLGSNSFHLMVARVVLKDNDFRLKKMKIF